MIQSAVCAFEGIGSKIEVASERYCSEVGPRLLAGGLDCGSFSRAFRGRYLHAADLRSEYICQFSCARPS